MLDEFQQLDRLFIDGGFKKNPKNCVNIVVINLLKRNHRFDAETLGILFILFNTYYFYCRYKFVALILEERFLNQFAKTNR